MVTRRLEPLCAIVTLLTTGVEAKDVQETVAIAARRILAVFMVGLLVRVERLKG
jgi:hypothetical protein